MSDRVVVVAGTLLGKIWLYDSKSDTRIPVAMFSDDSVRGIYCNDSSLYAAIGDLHCKEWKLIFSDDVRLSGENPIIHRFERRSSSQMKYILQKDERMMIVYPGMTTFYNLLTKRQTMVPYRLLGSVGSVSSACPLDFTCNEDLSNPVVAFIEQHDEEAAETKIKMIEVQSGEIFHYSGISLKKIPPSKDSCVFCSAPLGVGGIFHRWGKRKGIDFLNIFDNFFIYSAEKWLVICRLREGTVLSSISELNPGEGPVMSHEVTTTIPEEDSERLVGLLSANGTIRLWKFLEDFDEEGIDSKPFAEISIFPFSDDQGGKFPKIPTISSESPFSFGFPYLMRISWRAKVCVVSSDVGVHLVRFESREEIFIAENQV